MNLDQSSHAGSEAALEAEHGLELLANETIKALEALLDGKVEINNEELWETGAALRLGGFVLDENKKNALLISLNSFEFGRVDDEVTAQILRLAGFLGIHPTHFWRRDTPTQDPIAGAFIQAGLNAGVLQSAL